jgi:hypothetical protein
MTVSNGVPFAIASSAAGWMLCILGLLVWMWFHPREHFGGKILVLIVVFLALGPICGAVMNSENAHHPLKFDYFLYRVDHNLGVSAFSVARRLAEWQRSVLYQLYQSLTLAMVVWYGVNIRRRDGRPNRLLIAYAVNFAFGCCLYLVLPACGPRHAFGAAFPAGNPVVPLLPVKLDRWPNAIPSLHLSTALLFVLFAGRSRVLRGIAWVYLAGTVAATLAFEHYTTDLIVAVPFACFVTRAAEGKSRRAAYHLAIVLAWMLSIRYATPVLVASPAVLRIVACSTVAFAAFSMGGKRMRHRAAGRSCPAAPCATAARAHTQRGADPLTAAHRVTSGDQVPPRPGVAA